MDLTHSALPFTQCLGAGIQCLLSRRYCRLVPGEKIAETYKLTVTVFSQDKSVHAIRGHVQLLRKGTSESCGIKGRPRAEDLSRREPRDLSGEMSQDVDGVGDE